METIAAAPPNLTAAQESGAPEIEHNRETIDRITYLASLASRYEDVDPMMDTLRQITASWDGEQPLKAEELKSLHTLERELKDYLIAKDPVRSFTVESLELQLKVREQGGSAWMKSALSLLAVLGPAVLAAGIPFALPPSLVSQEVRILLAIPLFFVALHIGISWLYLSALKNFQQEVREAFQLICVGVVLFGLTFSQYAAIPAFGLAGSSLFEGAGFTWLVALPYIFIFLGLRIYARQIQVKSRLLSWWFVSIVAAVLAAAAVAESALILGGSDSVLEAFLVVGGRMVDVFTALGALLAWKIRKAVAPSYARPMTWLFVYLVFSFLGSALTHLLFLVGTITGTGGSSTGEATSFYILMAAGGVPVQLLLMWTGFVFKRELSK